MEAMEGRPPPTVIQTSPNPSPVTSAGSIKRHGTPQSAPGHINRSDSPLLTPPSFEPDRDETRPYKASDDDIFSLNQYRPHTKSKKKQQLGESTSKAVSQLSNEVSVRLEQETRNDLVNAHVTHLPPSDQDVNDSQKKVALKTLEEVQDKEFRIRAKTPTFDPNWTFGARNTNITTRQISNEPRGSARNQNRRSSISIWPGQSRRASLVSSGLEPKLIKAYTFGSLINNVKRTRKSSTGVIEQARAMTQADKESQRIVRHRAKAQRRASVEKSRNMTPAMITLRKASVAYGCQSMPKLTAISSQETLAELSVRPVLIAASLTKFERNSNSGSTKHPLLASSTEADIQHRKSMPVTAVTVTEACGDGSSLDTDTESLQEDTLSHTVTRRDSSFSRVLSGRYSHDIIWKRDGTPSSMCSSQASTAVPSRRTSLRNEESVYNQGQMLPRPPRPRASVAPALPSLPENPILDPTDRNRPVITRDLSGFPWEMPAVDQSGTRPPTTAELSPGHSPIIVENTSNAIFEPVQDVTLKAAPLAAKKQYEGVHRRSTAPVMSSIDFFPPLHHSKSVTAAQKQKQKWDPLETSDSHVLSNDTDDEIVPDSQPKDTEIHWQKDSSQAAYEKIKRVLSHSTTPIRDSISQAPSMLAPRRATSYDSTNAPDVAATRTSPTMAPATDHVRRTFSEPSGRYETISKRKARFTSLQKAHFSTGLNGTISRPLSRRTSLAALRELP